MGNGALFEYVLEVVNFDARTARNIVLAKSQQVKEDDEGLHWALDASLQELPHSFLDDM